MPHFTQPICTKLEFDRNVCKIFVFVGEISGLITQGELTVKLAGNEIFKNTVSLSYTLLKIEISAIPKDGSRKVCEAILKLDNGQKTSMKQLFTMCADSED